jgi:hypothetical protein
VVHDRGYREGCGQLSQDDSHEISSSGSKLVSPNTFGIVASSFGESASPAMGHRAPTGNDSTGVGSTAPPAAKGSSSENDPVRDSNTQERAKVDCSEIKAPEDPTVLLGQKRLFTHDNTVQIRTQTDKAPERKRPRRDNVIQQPPPQEDTVSIRSQADVEPELKQLWMERWKEGGEKRQLKVKGRGRKQVGLLGKSKQRKKSELTSEEISKGVGECCTRSNSIL